MDGAPLHLCQLALDLDVIEAPLAPLPTVIARELPPLPDGVPMTTDLDEAATWPGGHLLWGGRLSRNGYGLAEIPDPEAAKGYRLVNAHRQVLTLVAGPAPSDRHQAAHDPGCISRACISPGCLSWLDQRENLAQRKTSAYIRAERAGQLRLIPGGLS